ncbi:hypothetical protein, variant 1 [Aphanomyces astaci]|uniref:RING-type domain-containing protein n=1 Tax=Aphanomyces astaci TaxID=112090 RepID=W4GZW0_APHAT|nr:hypothetical protein, variant 1 [Aphanomyces astaci]ETV85187.1 hypothetical protein, variant 1 [Aphanomyces astaci]|eukprot:XP_009825205.1 hypothetical protein, variant 1 [Aphanomyces astaci]
MAAHCVVWWNKHQHVLVVVACSTSIGSLESGTTGKWTKLSGPDANSPARREGTILQVIGDIAYIYGGLTNNTMFTDTWKFDLLHLEWTRLVTTVSPGYRFDHVGTTHGTDVYVFGGSVSNTSRLQSGTLSQMNDMWKLDSLIDQWVQITPPSCIHRLPAPRTEAVAVPTGDAMVVFGGVVLPSSNESAADFNDIWQFRYDTETWREVVPKANTPLPLPRFSHTATTVTVHGVRHMIVLSGRHIIRDGWSVLADAWMLPLVLDDNDEAPTWILLSVSPVYNRLFGGAVSVSSSLWMFGGFAFYSHSERDGLAYSDTVAADIASLMDNKVTLFYDYTSSDETTRSSPHARFHHAMAVWRDQVLVFGGKFLQSYGDLWLRNTTMFPTDPNPYQPRPNALSSVVFVFVSVFWLSSVVGYLCLFAIRICFPPFNFRVRMMPLPPLRHRGLSFDEITAFKLVPFVARKDGGGSDELCSICLADFEPRERLRELSCQHRYHPACIDTWLAKSQSCPLCKRHLASPKATTWAGRVARHRVTAAAPAQQTSTHTPR